MKAYLPRLLLAGLFVFALNASALTRYVDLNCATPTPPYTNWPTAATNIQDAIDAAADGDLVLVTNGVYQTGGRAVFGTMTNRVAVTKPLTLQSVNGPEVTIIQGYRVPGVTNGDGAIRCVYLTNGATLNGFTLTNGATRTSNMFGERARDASGGGLWCEDSSAIASNCVFKGNAAYYFGGGAFQGTLNNCTFLGNTAIRPVSMDGGGAGGGVNAATLNNCILVNNFANDRGGGAGGGILNNCVIVSNTASSGGGAYYGTLSNCTITGNIASGGQGGGTCRSDLINSTLLYNLAVDGGGSAYGNLVGCNFVTNKSTSNGGGAFSASLMNCKLLGNSANIGGGANACVLDHCALTNNTASFDGGGVFGGTLNKCILTGNAVSIYPTHIWFAGGGACNATLNGCTLLGNQSCIGGGARGGTLNNCVLKGNYASSYGGGAYGGTLNNCTVVGNVGGYATGGVDGSIANNCIIYSNASQHFQDPNSNFSATFAPNSPNPLMNFCCTLPQPPGAGNITNELVFVDFAGGDFRLQTNSPCINAGKNSYVGVGTDFDGNPRIVGGTVDLGAYEFQSPGTTLSYAWAQRYGLPTDGSVDFVDSDGDGEDNWREAQADTSPTNAQSVLRMIAAVPSPAGVVVSWQSVPYRRYAIEVLWFGPGLNVMPVGTVQTGAASGTNTYTDQNRDGCCAYFYRVRLQ